MFIFDYQNFTELHMIVAISFPSTSDTKNHSKKEDVYSIMVKCLYQVNESLRSRYFVTFINFITSSLYDLSRVQASYTLANGVHKTSQFC